MESFANELRMMIFADLSTNDLLSCRRVSRSWNHMITNLFEKRLLVVINSQAPVNAINNGSLLATFRKLAEDKLAPTFATFGQQIRFINLDQKYDYEKHDRSKRKRQWLRVLMQSKTEMLSQVHTLTFDKGTRLLFLCGFLNNFPNLESLTVTGFLDQTGSRLRIKRNTLEHLSSFDISGGQLLSDLNLLALTAIMPNLTHFNVATKNMHFCPYDTSDLYWDNDDALVLQPTGVRITFAGVRAALKHHITRLKTIRFCSSITPDSIAHLLDYDTLTDIYIEGTMYGDAEVGKEMLQLKKRAKSVGKNIHYEFRQCF